MAHKKQPLRCGSRGVGIYISPQVAKDWTKGGNEVTRGRLSTGEIYMYIAINPNTITSNSTDYNSLTLVSSYFLDSSKTKELSEFQAFVETFSDSVRSIDRNRFVIIGADINASARSFQSQYQAKEYTFRASKDPMGTHTGTREVKWCWTL
jgi:hypothetical protein